ncbi:glycerophosphodiester phosphodiesterase [Bacillus alkalicellulosilyticus]|uniref:glycerophosphodiester phosphodiesterase n=1 Tax=Alkalihalobacterium alkalicellulosilyticum TaxID=1912214 RepID=UPI000995E035|nr:glycerophosphodiester phosphodiesterase [Bacillus alkalicellulosilyticus]
MKRAKLIQRFGVIALITLFIWIGIYFFPVSEQVRKPFFSEGEMLVIAHQGGEHLAPSNTLVAFEQAVEIGVDVIEFDIHITSDNHLVAIHDPTVDRTTNGSGVVAEMSLAELKKLDAGFYFRNLEGDYSYREQGVTIPTVEEIFSAFPNIRMNIEIKDTNPPDKIELLCQTLWSLIEKYELEEKVLIAAFDQNIIDTMSEASNHTVAVSGGKQEVTKFVIFHKLFLNGLYRPKVDAIQVPTEQARIDLTDSYLIKMANKKGLDVHYWTINDRETMEYLVEQGANGIITDRPDILLEVLGR